MSHETGIVMSIYCYAIFWSKQNIHYVLPRVGHSLFGFLSESLVFCERNSDLLFSKSESLSSPFLKSDGSNSLLGIKRYKRG